MTKAEAKPITFWVIASKPYPEKISNAGIFTSPEVANAAAMAMNRDYQPGVADADLIPMFKAYEINGSIAAVDA